MRKFVVLALVFVLAFTTFADFKGSRSVVEASTKFSDVRNEHINEVSRLVDDKIIAGFPDGTFKPNAPVTRAEAVTMIGRAINMNGTQRATKFSDVPARHWASGYIASGSDQKIVGGYEDGAFRPSKTVTRAEMAMFLTRAFPLTEGGAANFSDVPKSHMAYPSIDRIATARISTGYPDGTFRPNGATTRVEFALFLARTLYPEYRPPEIEISGADVKDAIVVNAATGLNVRPTPSTDQDPIARLQNGTRLQVLSVQGSWAEIVFQSIHGYVHTSYISYTSDKPLHGKVIAVDPGHGGRDPGASAFGVTEKEIVLDVGLRLQKKLEAAGAKVVMTRSTDVFLTLDERVQIAKNANANSFVSIHVNGASAESANGTETYWDRTNSSADSKKLADLIQKQLTEKLKLRDRGVKEAGFYVIKNTTMPSVLVELGFVTNQTEAGKMKTAQFREDSAEAIYQGLLQFYK
ncbi:N-acetylmuramoyl-L-alanine amidase [Anaerobacillus sp. MEB173]|uniref:N-acetylmuramoyl-L-alanine amidase n=1 Tax=Anaerobacillus sp. MEB173 TaxID=3383345 RepID=UPI003F912C2B